MPPLLIQVREQWPRVIGAKLVLYLNGGVLLLPEFDDHSLPDFLNSVKAAFP
jgi:hypothetical protein